MVTGSHNPPQYNGLKIVIDKIALHGEVIRDLRRRIETGDLRHGHGGERSSPIRIDYIRRLSEALPLAKPCKVVVDCGNAIAARTAPPLLRALGCEVVELFCEVDGRFPHHHPDPSIPENLIDLQMAVREHVQMAVREHGADIGLAFDGDADRLGVVTDVGEIVWPDRVLMPLAEEVLTQQPGAAVVYDIKCSWHLTRLIERLGGQPILWKTGHSLIKAKMRETGALLGGEMAGHFVHADDWFGFDDAFYAAARLLRLLTRHGVSSTEFFAAYRTGLNTPELRLDMAEGEPFAFMARLTDQADFGTDARIITLDGLADYHSGRLAGRIPARLGIGTRLQHHAQLDAALRGRRSGCHDRHSGPVPSAIVGAATEFSFTLLTLSVYSTFSLHRLITAWPSTPKPPSRSLMF